MLSTFLNPMRKATIVPQKLRDFRVYFEPRGGGPTITVRAMRPEDKSELQVAFHSLSPKSRLQRFFAPVGELTEAQWEYLSDVDGMDHVALVAVQPTANLQLEPLALVRYSPSPAGS